MFDQRKAEDDLLLEIASTITPDIWPTCEPETVVKLSALAADMPELLTREPPNIGGPRFDFAILPLTPLLLLHANVIDLAMHLLQSGG